jgi:hypothetical protein
MYNKKIMALWKRKSKKNGQDYLYGIVDLGVGGSVNVVAFPNTKKKGESSPDYTGILSEPKVSEEEEVVEEAVAA